MVVWRWGKSRFNHPQSQPISQLPHLYSDPYGMVVYQLSAGDVRLTMVDGKILFRDGQLLMMEDGLASRAEKSLQRVVAGAGIAL